MAGRPALSAWKAERHCRSVLPTVSVVDGHCPIYCLGKVALSIVGADIDRGYRQNGWRKRRSPSKQEPGNGCGFEVALLILAPSKRNGGICISILKAVTVADDLGFKIRPR